MTEFILLVEGIEQEVFLPNLMMFVGVRSPQGGEFCIGPNISMTGIGYAMGLGETSKQGELNIPVNFFIALNKKSFRFGLLFGFNAEKG